MNSGDSIPGNGRFQIRVLGCRVNQAEARQIEESLEKSGLRESAPGEEPDLIVLHTCAVTAEAEAQSAQQLRRLRARHPGACLVWSGCGAGRRPADGVADFTVKSGPDWNTRWSGVLAGLPTPSPYSQPRTPGAPRAGRVRAFLKVQDGCDLSCAYCLVPTLRGPSRDLPPKRVLEEARALVASGCPELVVTGVSVGLYGRDHGGLAALLARLADLPGLERIRLSSLHPAEVDADLLRVWSDRRDRILPHLHLPLQSGSDRVLTAMRRGYSVRGFREAVDRAREYLENPAITTDLIAGFPGENEADHRASMHLCEAIGFARMHVFPFSLRPGTEAARLPDPVPMRVVRTRAGELRTISDRLASLVHNEHIGRTVRVLVESRIPTHGLLFGYTERYLPVRFQGPGDWIGSLRTLGIISASLRGLQGLPSGAAPGGDLPVPGSAPNGASS